MFHLKAFKLLALDNFAGGYTESLACSQFLVKICMKKYYTEKMNFDKFTAF